MTKTTLTFDFTAVELTEVVRPDTNGKPVTWVNVNIEEYVKIIMVEIAKANGYHVPKEGLGWSCQKKIRGLGMGAGFVKAKPEAEEKPAAKAEKPAKEGASDPGLGDRLATIEKALAMLLSQGSHAPAAKQSAKRAKAG